MRSLSLATQPWYFVIAGREIRGIVTRADLQRPAVAMVTFSFVISAELAINTIVEGTLGPEWLDRLPKKQREHVEQIYADRRAADVEIGHLECLMLHQRLALLGKCPAARELLGFRSNKEFRQWGHELCRLRDVLAHGGTILHVDRDPLTAIAMFTHVRQFAEATSRVGSEVSARREGR